MVPTERLVFLLGILMVFFTCAIAVPEDGGIQSEIQQANEDLVISNTSLNEQRARDHFNIVRKLLPLKGNASQLENLKRLIMKNAEKSHKPVIHDASLVELGATGSHLRKNKASGPSVSLKRGASRTSISSTLTEASTKSDFTNSLSSQQGEEIQTETGDEVKSLSSVTSLDQVSLSEASTIQTSEVSDSTFKSSFSSTDPSPTDIDSMSSVHETGDVEALPSSTLNAEPTLQHSSVSNAPVTETTDSPNVDSGAVTTEDASVDKVSDGTDLQRVEIKTTVESVLHSTSVKEESTSTSLSSAELSSQLSKVSSSYPNDLEPTTLSVIRVTQTITHYLYPSEIAETYTSPADTLRSDLTETLNTADPQNGHDSMVSSSPENMQDMPSIISIEDGLKPLPFSSLKESTLTTILHPSENNQDGDFSTVYKYLTVHRPTSDLHAPLDALIIVSATGFYEDVSSLSYLIEGILNSGVPNKVSTATQELPLITENIAVSVTLVADDVSKIEPLASSNSISVFPSTSDVVSSNIQPSLSSERPSDKLIISDTSSEAQVSPTTLFAISSSNIVNERIEVPYETLHSTAAHPQYSTPPLPENLKTKARHLDSLETKLSKPLPAVDNSQVGNGIPSSGFPDAYKERHKLGSSDSPYSGERNSDILPGPHSNRQANDIPGHPVLKDPSLNHEAERNTYRPEIKDDKNLVKPGGIGKDILNMKPLPYKISVSPQFQNHDATPKNIPKQVYGKPKIDWVNWMRNTKSGKNDNAWDNSIARPDNSANGDLRNKNGNILSSSSPFSGTTSYKSHVAVHTSTSDFPNGKLPSIEPAKTFDMDAHSLIRTTLYHSTLSLVATHIEQTQNEVDQKLASKNKADLIEEIKKKVLGSSPAETLGHIDVDEALGTNFKSDLRQKQDESVVDYMKRILPLIERIADGGMKSDSSTDMLPLYGLNTHSPGPSRMPEAQRTQLLHTLPSQIFEENKNSPPSSVALEKPNMLLNDPMSVHNSSLGAHDEYSQTLYAYEDDNYIYEYVYDSPDVAQNLDAGELYESSGSSRTDSSINTKLTSVKDVNFDNDKSAFKTFKNKADLTTSYKKQQLGDLEQAKSGPKESRWKSLSDSRRRLSDSAKSDTRKADSGEGKNLFSFLHNDNTKDRHVSNTNNKKNTHKLSNKIHKFNLNPFGIFSYESAASRLTDYIPSLFNGVFLFLFSIMCL